MNIGGAKAGPVPPGRDRRRWLARMVKIMLLAGLIAALVPFCSGLLPRGDRSDAAPRIAPAMTATVQSPQQSSRTGI